MKKSAAYAKLLRIPGLGGLAIPTVIGGLTVGVYDFYNLSLLFIIGAFAAIYGFILNDYADVELDRLVKDLHGKPIVSGDISKKTAVTISIFCILFTFLFIAILWRGQVFDNNKFAAVVSLIIAGFLGSIYNLYGKKILGSDFFVAISMGFVFLFGALSFGMPNILTWIIFFLTFNQTLHMNSVEGGIKDADHDYKMGAINMALKSGVMVDKDKIFIPKSFQVFGMSIRLFSAILLFLPFVYFGYNYHIIQILVLAILTLLVILLSAKLVTIKTFDRSKIQKYIGFQSFLRYSLVPIMLISLIPWYYSIILIFFPIVWYIVFTPLVGERLFRPRM